jgi:hypothetical protein
LCPYVSSKWATHLSQFIPLDVMTLILYCEKHKL